MGHVTLNSIGWFYEKTILRKGRIVCVKKIGDDTFCKMQCDNDSLLIPYGNVYSTAYLARKYEN